MTTQDYLDALAALSVQRGGRPSGYAIAQMLGIRRCRIVRYRHHDGHFDDDLAVQVADLLGVDRGAILCDMAAQRAKSPEMAKQWRKLAAHFHRYDKKTFESAAA